MIKLFCVFLGLLSAAPVFSQAPIIMINSVAADSSCMSIRTIRGSLDTMQGKWVGIYNAEIKDDCLELSIMYGNCKPEMEFVTNGEVYESRGNVLTFLLKYMVPVSNPCKDTQRTKIRFDLLPYKNIRPGKVIYIALKGNPLVLTYVQKQVK